MSIYPAPLDSLDTYTSFDTTDLAALAGQPEGMLPGNSALQNLLAGINRQEGVPGYAEAHLTDLYALLQQYGNLGTALFHFGPGGSGCVNAQGQAVGWCYVQQVLGFAGLTGNETAADLGSPAGAGAASRASCYAGCSPQAFGICLNPATIMQCNQAGAATEQSAGAAGASSNCQASILGATFTDPVCAFRNWIQNAGVRILVIMLGIVIGLVALNALLGGAPAQIILKPAKEAV
jgi:hypothetical protein